MQRSKLIALVDTQSFSDEEALGDVSALSARHPWCSTFQVLKAIGLRQYDALEAKEQLNLASVYINDRSKLYSYTVRHKLRAHIDTAQAGVREPASAKMEKGASHISVEISVNEKLKAGDETSSEEQVDNFMVSSEALPPREAQTASEPFSSEEAALLDNSPLESQILVEAMTHLGELEWQTQVQGAEVRDVEALQFVPSTVNDSKHRQNNGLIPGYKGESKFSKWLLSLDARDEGSGVQESEEDNAGSPAKSQQLIEKFIQESPQISPAKANFFSPSQMGKMSLVEDESFVSETLAKIYERQGDYKKAVRAYKQLSLKYPEKSVYFAALQKKAEAQI